MKTKLIICLIAVFAFSAVGFGFAKWSDAVTINATANSGDLKWGFLPGSFFQMDDGPDRHSEMAGGMNNVFTDAEKKDVGSTEGEFVDTNNDGVLDTLNVTVSNAYPCYYNEISAKVKNFGTIPTIIQVPVLHWGTASVEIEEGSVYYLCKDGTIVKNDWSGAPGNAVIEVDYMNNIGAQQHPDGWASNTGPREESLDFHVLQPAEQNTTYEFSYTVEAIQWNESPIPAS